jgi:hypothetical protein
MNRVLHIVGASLMSLLLAACGGGGGSAGNAPFGSGNGSGGGTGGGNAVTYSVALTLSAQTVTSSQPATVTARVASSAGSALSNQVVSFSTSTGLGAFSAATALTNADGVATVTLSPATASAVGADTVIASTTVNGAVVSGSLGFQLTATNVTISAFTADIGTASLGAYGQTLLTVTLAGTSPSNPVNVAISSSCVTSGRATLTPATATTSTGTATFTYRDAGCGAFAATDGLQASVTGTAATATRSITLTPPTPASIAFVSAAPNEIYLKGSGFAENSIVSFQVRDANGLGVPNQVVTLEATSLAGGLLIDDGSAPVTKRTDSNGNVLVRINAGTVPTPVRVRATLAASNISTVSSNLAVAVGLPSQQNFSLSQGSFNIEGYNIDGRPNTYQVIASDRLGNPVPEGTAINFVTEGGQVQAIRFTTLSNGLASATANFQSSSPRPPDGRVTVLAYALGEESFLDTNGDNVFTPGEDYQDLGDVFLDRLFNGSFNGNEDQFISLSITGVDACRTATSPLLRLSSGEPSRVLSSTGAALNTCVSGWGRAYVRKAIQTVFATSETRLGWRAAPDARAVRNGAGSCLRVSLIDQISAAPYANDDSASSVSFYHLGDGAGVALANLGKTGSVGFLVADSNPIALNPAAAGTTISAVATSGLSVSVLANTVPSTLSPSATAISYTFDDTTTSGTVTISVRSPGGLTTVFAQTFYRNAGPTSTPCL